MSDSNVWALSVAVFGALLSLAALGLVWRKFGGKLSGDAEVLPRNVQLVVNEVRRDYEEKINEQKRRFEQEMADLKREHEAVRALDALKISELQKQAELQQKQVDWLWKQFLGAGGQAPPPVVIPKVEAINIPVTVLGIWPSSDLSIRAEIDAVFKSGVQYAVIDTDVTKRRVLSEVDRTRPAILHVGAHATAEGVLLDDGNAPVGWWRNLAQRYPFRLVVLNACESLDIVDAMQDAGVTAVVGMRKDIGDKVAVLFATEFYAWLMRGRTVEESVSLAKLALNYIDAELVGVRDKTGWAVGKG